MFDRLLRSCLGMLLLWEALGGISGSGIALFPGVAWAQEEAAVPVFTLKEVLQSTLQTNETLQIARERIRQGEFRRDQALGAFFPTLGFEGVYTRFPEKGVAFAVGVGPPRTILLQPHESYQVQIQVEQLFYTGGRLRAGLRQTQHLLEASRWARQQVTEDLLLQVAQRYYQVLQAQEDLEVEERNLQRLREHLRRARARQEVGEVTQAVVLRAEAEVAGGEAAVTAARTRLLVLRDQLRSLAGLPEDFQLARPPSLSPPLPPLQDLLQKARIHRADLEQRRAEEQAAREAVRQARATFFPTLGFRGEYVFRDQDPKTAFFIEETWSAGVQLQFSLFDGGQRRATLLEQRSRLREAQLARQRLLKDIQVEVRQAWLELRSAQQQVESRKKQVAAARENYRMVSQQFEVGLVTQVEVLDANTLLRQAERDLTRALLDRDLALLALQRATGTLLEFLGLKGQS